MSWAGPYNSRGTGWLPAAWLRAGDLLSSHDGKYSTVEKVADTGRVTTVYNLQVEDAHTYFVGSQEWGVSVWAHNSNACIGKLEAEVNTLKAQRANMQIGSREHTALTQRLQRVEQQLAATKSLPAGSTVVEVDPKGNRVKYRDAKGQERIRFKADEAVTFEQPRRHNPSIEREAGFTTDGKIEVLEGRNRAVGTAHGDTVPKDRGGVPEAPGWLDYEFRNLGGQASPSSELKPIRGMPRAN